MPLSARLVAIREKEKATTPNELASKIERLTESYANELVKLFRIYPSTVSTTYVRTGRLRDEWRVFRSIAGGNISYVIFNEARNPRTHVQYASFVMGTKQTPYAQALGWRRVQDMLDRSYLAKQIQAAIREALA